MKLPHSNHVVVPKAKIIDYLLSLSHPEGRGKAQWFRQRGFTVEFWTTLSDALKRHVVDHEVATVEDSRFGIRYTIEGWLASPDRTKPLIRSVWFVETGEDMPRFVTAYPIRRIRT